MTREEKISKLLEIAKSLIGVPYKYGATIEDAPNFFDCSLFTQYIFGKVGEEIPRSTILQAEKGEEIKLEDIQAGDLLFLHGTWGFYNPKFPQGIGHVVIYIGEGKTLHAASNRIQENPVVEKGEVEEKTLDEVIKKYEPLITTKRIIN